MATSYQPRTKDHWSVRLHIKHPGTGNRTALIVLMVVQALLLVLTASSIATGGGLYGCSSACGTKDLPTTPAIAVLLGMLMLLLPMAIGFLSETWQGAIAAASIPWIPAILIGANSLLAPTASVVPGEPVTISKGHTTTPLVSHFGPPFWLSSTQVLVLFLSLLFFALLGWLGWVIGGALQDARPSPSASRH